MASSGYPASTNPRKRSVSKTIAGETDHPETPASKIIKTGEHNLSPTSLEAQDPVLPLRVSERRTSNPVTGNGEKTLPDKSSELDSEIRNEVHTVPDYPMGDPLAGVASTSGATAETTKRVSSDDNPADSMKSDTGTGKARGIDRGEGTAAFVKIEEPDVRTETASSSGPSVSPSSPKDPGLLPLLRQVMTQSNRNRDKEFATINHNYRKHQQKIFLEGVKLRAKLQREFVKKQLKLHTFLETENTFLRRTYDRTIEKSNSKHDEEIGNAISQIENGRADVVKSQYRGTAAAPKPPSPPKLPPVGTWTLKPGEKVYTAFQRKLPDLLADDDDDDDCKSESSDLVKVEATDGSDREQFSPEDPRLMSGLTTESVITSSDSESDPVMK